MHYKLGGHREDPHSDRYLSFDKKIYKTAAVFTGEADLRPYSAARQNQITTSSCVAHAVIKALEIKRCMKYGLAAHVDLSVLDLYYGARDLMTPKETDRDEGTQIYLACDVLRRYGVCREVMHPFKEENLYRPPPILATREAFMNKIDSHYKIMSTGWDRVDDVIAALRSGNPIAFGTMVGENWMNYTNDSEPLRPVKWEDAKGRHATCLVGYVDGKFITENSWSEFWGDNGFGWLQPEVIADDQSKDFWVINLGSDVFNEGKK
jgi:C1A family cysteine protease